MAVTRMLKKNIDIFDVYPYSELYSLIPDASKMIRARAVFVGDPNFLDLIILESVDKEKVFCKNNRILLDAPKEGEEYYQLGLSVYERDGHSKSANFPSSKKGIIMTTMPDCYNRLIYGSGGSNNGDSGAGVYAKDMRLIGMVVAVKKYKMKHPLCDAYSFFDKYTPKKCSSIVGNCVDCKYLEACCPNCTFKCNKCRAFCQLSAYNYAPTAFFISGTTIESSLSNVKGDYENEREDV